MTGVWCVAQTRQGRPSPNIFELLTPARRIADARGEKVSAVLLGGDGVGSAAAELASRGADRVLVVEHAALAEYLDDAYAAALAALAAQESPRTVLFPATVFGRSLAPRLAVALRSGLAAEAIALELDAQKNLLVTRSSYAGNVIATVSLRKGVEIATVRPLAFERAGPTPKTGEITRVPYAPAALAAKARFDSFSPDAAGEVDLGGAEKIVSGGRGLGKPEGFELVRALAKAMGAAVGASRATVDAGWIPYKHQVGLTGRSVRPRLYVACGISGQIQHLAGMNSSDVIVAINTDPDCPMMKLATYSLQGDVYQILPALIAEINRLRGDAPQINGR